VGQTGEVKLTPREQQVVDMLLRGLGPHSMAKELGVKRSTIRGYLRLLYVKFGLSPDRCERVQLAVKIYAQRHPERVDLAGFR